MVIVYWSQRDKRRIRFTPDRRILDPLLVKVRADYRSSLFGLLDWKNMEDHHEGKFFFLRLVLPLICFSLRDRYQPAKD